MYYQSNQNKSFLLVSDRKDSSYLKASFIILFLFLVTLFPKILYAKSTSLLTIFNDYFIDTGLSLKALNLDVYETKQRASLGTLTSKLERSFSLSIGSPFTYIKKGNVGYNFMMGFSSFEINKQKVNEKEVDLGTSTNGNYLYATPVLFYNLGDKNITNGKGHALKFGFGAGLGYLKAKGNIMLNNAETPEISKIDLNNLSFSYGFMIDYRFNRLAVHASLAGPELSGDKYDYFFYDYSITFSYSFDIKEAVNTFPRANKYLTTHFP